MADPNGLRTDQKVEQIIGSLLRIGVVLSALVTLLGAILYLGHAGRHLADYRVFRGEPLDLREVSAIVTSALAGRREAVIQLGVLILISTPIARVVFSLVAFAVQRDGMYVAVTFLVLVILLCGLLGVGL